MLSAWRKFTKKQDEKPVFPLGVAPVDQSMQKKYAKGVHYNMKLIIKGDRNTGKSVLLQRLAGNKFKEDYIPTQEIQVANVNWSYQGNGDVVKTEVWDIVDKSKKKRSASGSLKIANDDSEVKEEPSSNPMEDFSLDAEFIDVYKGTHGVFLTMDITKAWTWKYVQRELEKIPPRIPVMILANFRDLGHHRVVDSDEVRAYIQHLDRPTGSAEVYFTESSMKDGFGLQFLHGFLNMPFLLLQRETIMRQLEANTLEIEDTREMLSYDDSSEQQNYDLFQEALSQKLNPPKSESPALSTKTIEPTETPSTPSQFTVAAAEPPNTLPPQTATPPPSVKLVPVATVTPTVQSPPQPQEEQQPQPTSKFQAYKAKFFGSKTTPVKEEPTLDISDLDVVPIEDFNPGMLDNNFLDNTSSKNESRKVQKVANADSSDDEDGNPMVAAYEDFDDDSDIDENVLPTSQTNVGVKDDNFPDSDNDEEDFEDFSSDEETPKNVANDDKQGVSIMERIKTNKKIEKQRKEELNKLKEIEVSTQQLDINEHEYSNLESDEESNKKEDEIVDNVEIITKLDDVVDSSVSKTQEPAQTITKDIVETKAKERHHETDDESDESDSQPFVITGDVDVENDWLNGHESESESDEPKEEAQVIASEIAPNTPAETKKETSLNFDLDDLETFMSNQMSKANPTVKDVDETKEIEKPKKKKKKKTEPSSDTASGEKKKKKKKPKTEQEESSTTPKTKTKKTKKADTSDATVKKSTKITTKKKSTTENDLDAFFAS